MRHNSFTGVILFGCLLAALSAGGGPPAQAQQAGGYQVGEGDPGATPAPADDPGAAPGSALAADADAGPVRMARFSYLKGDVSWRPDATAEWSAASLNLPVRQGAQIWATGHSRAEIQFDDGSLLRLGADAIVTLQTLYSDSQGEFTELRLSQGLASLNLPHAKSLFQVDTLAASLKATGPARFRVGAASGTEVAVRQGKVNIEDAQGKTFLEAGDYTDITDPQAAFNIQDLPPTDGFDQFSQERDRVMAEGTQDQNLSPQEGLVAGNLDDYGQWHDDATYGQVWVPAESASSGWRPYNDGHWVWVEPFGWTWVGAEPWGWAPYHYGTWVHAAYGWGWCPGPHIQYWSPAVVDFVGCNGDIAWAPLCPTEVRYPSLLSVGFGGGNWSAFFSIGGCANYGYAGGGYCEPHRWDNVYCNRVTNIINVYHDGGHSYGEPFFNAPPRVDRVRPGGWIPANARLADGVSRVRPDGFGGAGRFEAVSRQDGAGLWARGHEVVAAGGPRSFAGPATVRPTPAAFTPTHTFQTGLRPSEAVLARPVYRAALAPNIARVGDHGGAFLAPSERVAPPVFAGGNRAAFQGGRAAFRGDRPVPGGGPVVSGGGRSAFGGRSGFRGGDPSGGNPAADVARARASLGWQRPAEGGAASSPVGGGFRGRDSSGGGSVPRGGGFRQTPGGGSFRPDTGSVRARPAPAASTVPAPPAPQSRPFSGGDGGGVRRGGDFQPDAGSFRARPTPESRPFPGGEGGNSGGGRRFGGGGFRPSSPSADGGGSRGGGGGSSSRGGDSPRNRDSGSRGDAGSHSDGGGHGR